MSAADDRRREDEAARENHRRLTPQELQNEHDRTKQVIADGKDRNGYFEREEQRLREEMARRGMQPRTRPND